MNILFVNYGDFTANSLNHIALFARGLCARGHQVVVAVPEKRETLVAVPAPAFIAATFDEVLAKPGCFPDGEGADVIHAWTPRENVRRFVLDYLGKKQTRLCVHLEDNEEYLLAAMLGCPPARLLDPEMLTRSSEVPLALSHPVRSRLFLSMAGGATVIVDALRALVPPSIPVLSLPPGVDFNFYHSQPADPKLRQELGLGENVKVVVFTGSNTFANELEIKCLYEAVALLNWRGIPTRLLRTGLNATVFREPPSPAVMAFVIDLGFIEKSRLPGLLALADVLVQPGQPGAFNDYRLPSKVPEMLAMGKPVVLPAANVGLELKAGEEAVVLEGGGAEAIAAACERVFAHPEWAQRIGLRAAEFARSRYNLEVIVGRLESFYHALPLVESYGGRYVKGTELTFALDHIRLLENHEGFAAYVEHLAAKQKSYHAMRDVRQELSSIKNQARQSAQHIANLEKIFSQKSTELLQAQQHIKNLEAELVRNREAIRLTDQHAKNLENSLSGKDSLLREKERALADQTAEAVHRADEWARQHREISSTCEALQHQLVALQEVLDVMQKSRSWRFTRPLRSASRWLEICLRVVRW